MSETHGFPGFLKCPRCASAMERETCSACGFEVPTEHGVPVFPFATGSEVYQRRLVTYEEVSASFADCFTLRGEGQTSGVYHLDGAHHAILQALPSDSVFLEVGCGGAQMRQYVESLGIRYTGTDVSRSNVRSDLQKHGGADFISDSHYLPVSDDSLDVVYSAAVTQYFADPYRAFQEIFRVLRPGGRFLSNCAFLEPWTDGSFFHTTPYGAIALLLSAGFEIEAMWPSHNYSGYQSLLSSGSRTVRMIRGLGTPMRIYAHLTYSAKRRLFGERYGDLDYAMDLARTAGGFDWIARKPEGTD